MSISRKKSNITLDSLLQDLKAGKFQPVYFLTGEETWNIDRITDFFSDDILREEEKPFNLQIFYGKDTNIDTVIMAARRYPMMSRYQVVIVKEAQQMIKLEITVKNMKIKLLHFGILKPARLLNKSEKLNTIMA